MNLQPAQQNPSLSSQRPTSSVNTYQTPNLYLQKEKRKKETLIHISSLCYSIMLYMLYYATVCTLLFCHTILILYGSSTCIVLCLIYNLALDTI